MRTIDYAEQELPMIDLLKEMGVDMKADFKVEEREIFQKNLEAYMINGESEPICFDLKKFCLEIQGADEAGHLHRCVLQAR